MKALWEGSIKNILEIFALKDDVVLEKKFGRDHGRGRARPLGPVIDESLSQLWWQYVQKILQSTME